MFCLTFPYPRNLLIYFASLVLGSLGSFGLAQTFAHERLAGIKDYVVYYGQGHLNELANYDLAIIQADTLSKREILSLKARGTLVIAYLSIGEVEPNRPWFSDGRYDETWSLALNENWGSYMVDVSQEGWQTLMQNLMGEYLVKGFDGIFLDTVDTIESFPQTTDAMIKLIWRLHETYPEAVLVQNRGFALLDKVANALDGLMFESLTGSYDFNKAEYIMVDNSFTAGEMVDLKEKTGLTVLALDYADNPATAKRAIETAQSYGFVPSVATIFLDDILNYELEPDGADDVRVRSVNVEGSGDDAAIVIIVENIGLSPAARVPVSVVVDGEQVATETLENLASAEQRALRISWASASETANIRVTAFSLTDKKAGNNSLSLSYKATEVATEPILPPDQQRLRPAENGQELVASALQSLLSIDGDLSDWGDMPCSSVGTAADISFGDASSWTGPDDLSAKVCYAWDAHNLYVGFNITDDALVQNNKGVALWRGDHVELWFDTQLQLDFDSASNSDDDFQLGLSPGNFDTTPADIFIWTPGRLRETYDGVLEWQVKQTSTGYSAEMRIPAIVLTGIQLVSGQTIGASFDPSDTDKPGSSDQEMMLSTAPKTQWGVPTLWNNLRLEGEPTVGVEVSAPVLSETKLDLQLSALNTLLVANVPSDVSAIIGYSFNPGDVSKPISEESLQEARSIVKTAAKQGALWLDADTGITNFADNFYHDPAQSYYPLVEAIVDEAHRHSIKVFFYFSGSEIETLNYSSRPEQSIDKVHPDWMQVDQFGDPMAFLPGEVEAFWLGPDTGDAWANPLAPEYREAIMTRAEKVAELGADGIFVDVPYYFIFDNRWADFSGISATAFKEATGYDLPYNLSEDGSAFYHWLAWRNQVWQDYFAEMNTRIKAKNPQTQMIVEEWPASSNDGILSTGYDTSKADAALDIAAHEYGHKQDEGGAIAYDQSDWQHTRDVYKWYQGMNRNNWCLCYATEAADSKAMAAITYMHHLSFWETKAPTMLDESAGLEWRQSLLAWVKTYQDKLNGAQPSAEVALLYSNHSRDLSFGSNLSSLIDMQHALDRVGIPYVVITEPNLQRIQDFPNLILPDVIYQTDALKEALANYQGELILLGDSLSQSAWGEERLSPPEEPVSVADALKQLKTTPARFVVLEEGDNDGKGLYLETFKQGDAFQIRLFDSVLNEDFLPERGKVTLQFGWQGETPSVSVLPFMGEPRRLVTTRIGDTIQIKVDVGLAAILTIH